VWTKWHGKEEEDQVTFVAGREITIFFFNLMKVRIKIGEILGVNLLL
jgi:hypothetical protein